MILAMAVVTGFQQEIREKVIGFGAHIQITNFDYNLTSEAVPITHNQAYLHQLLEIQGIRHIQAFATKAGILKTDEDIHGVIFKGVDGGFDWEFYSRYRHEGSFPQLETEIRSDEILISTFMANTLGLETGQDVFLYFIQDPPRIRRMTVSSTYDTGLEELDKIFVIGDIRHVQRLNDWSEEQIAGLEILLNDFGDMTSVRNSILEILPYDLDAKTIREIYPQIFDWLALLDMNVVVILILMLSVAAINMVTILLISILDRTNMIGILKTLGANHTLIRKVFLYHAATLIVRGMVIGNIFGLAIAWIQGQFGLFKLSQESYYVSEVPVNIEIMHLLILNAGTFLICMAMLVMPSMVITRISPVKAIRFS